MIGGGVSFLLLVALSLWTFFFFSALSLSSVSSSKRHGSPKGNIRRFWIDDDMFWKDGDPFQIIGGDLHYFRVLPQYWEDRLLRAKALGLNTIQTYVPWNLHEPQPGKWNFDGIADLESYLNVSKERGFLVMLRVGPYICAEWDLGGFPAWLLAIEPEIRLRSSDPQFLTLVKKWWDVLLPIIVPFLYENGGPIVMVQIENEFGSYGEDQTYLRYLVALARKHLGDEVILYTTDGGYWSNLENGTIHGENVYSAVDFSTGEDAWPIFKRQKEFNPPGKSPPLSSEFYTGWLTHWGDPIAKTDAKFTAKELQKILSRNASAVLYMAHGGTNFGFYNGANTGQNASDYQADLTSYDYDAPIKECGDVQNSKFKALRRVIEKYNRHPLPPIPPNNGKTEYGNVKVNKVASLFEVLNSVHGQAEMVQNKQPLSMESVGQMFGFLLYMSEFPMKESERTLSIPKVHDRAQVFVSCVSNENPETPKYVGIIERWSSKEITIPRIKCISNISLYVLVENLGRLNYGPYIYDRKGLLSDVFLDGLVLHQWKMFPIPSNNLDDFLSANPIMQVADSIIDSLAVYNNVIDHHSVPGYYQGSFSIDPSLSINDTFISLCGWSKGVVYVNNFNIGRFWPLVGPQCSLYVPAPILQHGENVVVIFELHAPHPSLEVKFVDHQDFSCGNKSHRT